MKNKILEYEKTLEETIKIAEMLKSAYVGSVVEREKIMPEDFLDILDLILDYLNNAKYKFDNIKNIQKP